MSLEVNSSLLGSLNWVILKISQETEELSLFPAKNIPFKIMSGITREQFFEKYFNFVCFIVVLLQSQSEFFEAFLSFVLY